MKFLIICILNLYTILFISCSDNPSESISKQLNVDVRMEVQILDSTYHLYSKPNTKIYFTTYKLESDGRKVDLLQSDTTSCPHGWGVKLLNFSLSSESDKIILGAACDNYDGQNYKEIEIDYAEAERRIDSLNHSSIVKTFAIYYE